MSGILFLGEDGGGRILRVGQGITQVGGDYALDVTTWDMLPAGEVGDCAFRTIDVAIKVTNGFHVGITPIVDGVALLEQEFTGSGSGVFQVQAFVAERGARLAARVRTIERAGDIELDSINASFTVLRRSP